MPTFGSANGSILFTAILPNSKISFGFGNSWSQFNEEYYKEFNGFKPDIWVPYIDIDKLTIYLNKF